MAFFWRFFGRLEDDTVLRLPIDRIAPNLVSWAFAGHSTRNERWKRQNIIISRMPLFWRLFGAFSAVSKTTLSCAYLFTELHQTWFLGLLQAILPETNVGNGKTLLLPDCHGFGAFLALFRRFFGRLEDDAVLCLPIDRIASNSVSWAFAGQITGIEHWKRENIIISRLPRFWRFFCAFSAVSKTTLSCAYPWTELHQTSFLRLLQAIPPESTVGNGKTSL